MRLVYLDEAGISNPAQEPYVVVAAVIVDADRSWHSLEQHLLLLSHEVDSDHYGGPKSFHAKDVWHGSGDFPRSDWPREKRLEILKALAQIPRRFGLPVVAGYVRRHGPQAPLADGREQGVPMRSDRRWAQATAFLSAVRRVESWMRKNAPNEVAMLIVEDTHEMRSLITTMHGAYTNRTTVHDQAFVARHIVDAVHFGSKTGSPMLQLADHAAFIIKRKLMRKADIEPLYADIAPQIFHVPVPQSGLLLTVDIDDLELVDAP